ncbi:hypothetical protein MTBLM5_240011 [Magnetospirillum sp. LM-5]|nr:hypothetical protein MTBLM5_240011 [Magnetospirillum sp. LM-5]
MYISSRGSQPERYRVRYCCADRPQRVHYMRTYERLRLALPLWISERDKHGAANPSLRAKARITLRNSPGIRR